MTFAVTRDAHAVFVQAPHNKHLKIQPLMFYVAHARPARATKTIEATPASSSAHYRLLRLERSRAQTQKGFKRLASAIAREAIGIH
jgi:hypothetical protein